MPGETSPLLDSVQTWARGQADRVRVAGDRRAGRTVRPDVVHRRARVLEVGRHRAGRAGRRVRRGHRLRRLGHRGLRPGLRVGHGGPSRPVDLPGAALARHQPGDGPDVLRHLDAGRLAVLRRPAVRAQAGAEEGGRPRLHLLHPPRGRVLPVQGPDPARGAADAGRPVRLLRPHPAEPRQRLPPPRDHHAGADGHLGGVLPPRGRARASRRSTCATPTRCPPPTT